MRHISIKDLPREFSTRVRVLDITVARPSAAINIEGVEYRITLPVGLYAESVDGKYVTFEVRGKRTLTVKSIEDGTKSNETTLFKVGDTFDPDLTVKDVGANVFEIGSVYLLVDSSGCNFAYLEEEVALLVPTPARTLDQIGSEVDKAEGTLEYLELAKEYMELHRKTADLHD